MEENVPNGNAVPQESPVIESPTVLMSDNLDKLAVALCKAQSEMKGAEKKSTNPFFNSGYADLHTVIEASVPYLNKHGIAVIQGNDGEKPGEFYVTTMLLHESGQWIKSKLRMPIEKATAQSIGSTITYGRRYGLSAIAGISQYDDDGNLASNKKGLTTNK
jgi:hypothetical protein|tara:strand:- start:2272 stop:2754 length:483 start_codon:yes stop_codon:yes gene_type:complete